MAHLEGEIAFTVPLNSNTRLPNAKAAGAGASVTNLKSETARDPGVGHRSSGPLVTRRWPRGLQDSSGITAGAIKTQTGLVRPGSRGRPGRLQVRAGSSRSPQEQGFDQARGRRGGETESDKDLV